MAMETVPARTPERRAFYDRLAPLNLSPLWEKLHNLVTAQPQSPCLPHIWHYREVRPPMLPLTEAQSTALLADLDKIGFSLGERRREAAE